MILLRSFPLLLRRLSSFQPRANLAPIEKAFINEEVQKLLKELTVVNHDKLFTRSLAERADAPEIKLMTHEQFERCKVSAVEKAVNEQLQIPPILKEREDNVKILESDPALKGWSKSRMFFVDISLNIDDRDRMVWCREPDGTLKTANISERRRISQIFLNRPHRTVHIPMMFFDPYLEGALSNKFYDYILRRACLQFEPDDPEFIRVCQRVYMYVDGQRDYQYLDSTRFYGPMIFYLTWFDRLDNILCYYLSDGKRDEVLKLLRLYKLLHPESQLASQPDTLEDLMKAYLDNHCKDKDAMLDVLKGKQEEHSVNSSS